MDRQKRSGLAAGILLILLGAWFLAMQLVPGWRQWISPDLTWPLIVVGVGIGMFLLALLTAAPGMAVPAAIVAGIGGILYWQNSTGNWASWAYAWTLIPGFVGVGVILAALLGEGGTRAVSKGAESILVSLVLFAIFGSFFGGWTLFGAYWPVLLIALGLVMLLRALLRPRRPDGTQGA